MLAGFRKDGPFDAVKAAPFPPAEVLCKVDPAWKTPEAFEQLVAPLERQVYFLCLRTLCNRQDAEDCAQEAMLRAYRAFGSFRGDSSVSTWLYTIAGRACSDLLRKRKESVSLDALRDAGWDREDGEPSPYLKLEGKERRTLLARAIEELGADDRRLITLVDLAGLRYEQAAGVLGLRLGTVKSRLNRARGRLVKIVSRNAELFDAVGRLNGGRRR